MLPDITLNESYPLSLLASQENDDVLHDHQAMKADDSPQFKEEMGVEINSLKMKTCLN